MFQNGMATIFSNKTSITVSYESNNFWKVCSVVELCHSLESWLHLFFLLVLSALEHFVSHWLFTKWLEKKKVYLAKFRNYQWLTLVVWKAVLSYYCSIFCSIIYQRNPILYHDDNTQHVAHTKWLPQYATILEKKALFSPFITCGLEEHMFLPNATKYLRGMQNFRNINSLTGVHKVHWFKWKEESQQIFCQSVLPVPLKKSQNY